MCVVLLHLVWKVADRSAKVDLNTALLRTEEVGLIG